MVTPRCRVHPRKYRESTDRSCAVQVAGVNLEFLGVHRPAGQPFSVQFAAIGFEVVVGSRSQERANELSPP